MLHVIIFFNNGGDTAFLKTALTLVGRGQYLSKTAVLLVYADTFIVMAGNAV